MWLLALGYLEYVNLVPYSYKFQSRYVNFIVFDASAKYTSLGDLNKYTVFSMKFKLFTACMDVASVYKSHCQNTSLSELQPVVVNVQCDNAVLLHCSLS